ncbi:SDR family NAD(P)-dependent oxidoreductase [Agromyces sp. NPDC058110]|uniref:SDR family NAD(P)-dependent oxidoreductase n=1 Tax=Agromyces sp. NPDC058110 TaxID=3346345 RepID=UPI0036DC6FC7
MDLGITGRRAFVSGSTQGIGYAIARALLEEGALVTINGRSEARVAQAVARLRTVVAGGRVDGVAGDLADGAEATELIGRIGDVDILVNNVGLFEVKPFDQTTDEDWQRFFDANVMSGVRLSRHLLPGMLSRGDGRVIFISSESGVNVPADMVHYGMTKAAMLAVANGLAKLTAGTAVTVNTVLGGPTYSDGVRQTVAQLASAQAVGEADLKAAIIGQNRTSLLQRFIEPDEIADLVRYLASPRSVATNGAALRADGGVLTTVL